MSRQGRQVFEFGSFRLIPQERQLFSGDKLVPLTPKSFDLLSVLVENAGCLVEKGELMNQVWPDSFVEEANLSVKMSEVRRALGEAPNDHRYIETVPRRGYRFVAEVNERSEGGRSRTQGTEGDESDALENVEGTSLESEAGSSQNLATRKLQLKGFIVGGSAVVLLAALVFAFDVAGLRSRFTVPANQQPVRSIGVLQLDNFSGDPSQDYFAHGMTDALITDLAKIGSLRVISLLQYNTANKPLSVIGHELNVDAILTGSVVRSGDRVRISVQLIRTATGESLWSKSYERGLTDVLSLQKEVARNIVGEIRVKLTPQEQLQFGNAPPVNPHAYDRYLLGKFYLNIQDKENNSKAIESLESAVVADPSFAAAYAELAQAYVWKIHLFAPNEPGLKEKAYVATEKALALDPNLAAAYLARGRLQWTLANHFPHKEAIREYRRALDLDPNLDEARNQLAVVYNHIGALDEALREVQQAVETNPGNSVARFRIGETLLFQGKYEEAVTALKAAPDEANPALSRNLIVWGLWDLGRREEATATLNQYLAENPEDNRGLLTSIQAVMAAASGHYDEAENKIQEAIEKGKGFGHFHHTEFQIACAYARMNKPQRALEFLEAAATDGFPCHPLFEVDPNLDSLRQHPRFIALLDRLRKQLEQFRSVS